VFKSLLYLKGGVMLLVSTPRNLELEGVRRDFLLRQWPNKFVPSRSATPSSIFADSVFLLFYISFFSSHYRQV